MSVLELINSKMLPTVGASFEQVVPVAIFALLWVALEIVVNTDSPYRVRR